MDRNQWKERLTGFGLPDEVVEEFLKSVPDEDLVRMKEYEKDEFLALLKEGLDETPEGDTTEETEPEVLKEEEPVVAEDTKELSPELKAFADGVVARITEALSLKDLEFDVPEVAEIKAGIEKLSTRLDEMEATWKEATSLWKDLSESEEDKLRGMVKNLSPAQKSRLRQSVSPEDAVMRVVEQLKEKLGTGASADGVVIKDAQGNTYKNLGDMAAGTPAT
jgi:hypothetical protein